jgi:hypothetical protein
MYVFFPNGFKNVYQESCLTIMVLPTSNDINTNLNSTQFNMTCRRPSVLDLITCILQVYIFWKMACFVFKFCNVLISYLAFCVLCSILPVSLDWPILDFTFGFL